MKTSTSTLIVLLSLWSCSNLKQEKATTIGLKKIDEKCNWAVSSRSILDNKLIDDKGLELSKYLTSTICIGLEISGRSLHKNFSEAYFKSTKSNEFNNSCLTGQYYNTKFKIQCFWNEVHNLVRQVKYHAAIDFYEDNELIVKEELNNWHIRNFTQLKSFSDEMDSLLICELPEDEKMYRIVTNFRKLCETSFYESELLPDYELYIEKLDLFRKTFPKSIWIDNAILDDVLLFAECGTTCEDAFYIESIDTLQKFCHNHKDSDVWDLAMFSQLKLHMAMKEKSQSEIEQLINDIFKFCSNTDIKKEVHQMIANRGDRN